MILQLFLISYTPLAAIDLPDFPQGEYISPEANIQLVEVVDFSTYTDPITDNMGRFSFADTESGEKWRLVLVNSDNITVMMEGEEPRIIGFDFPADNFFISHDNVYVVLTSRTATGDNALRINTETGEKRLFSCCPEEVWPGTLFVGTSGSVASWYEGATTFFDRSLVEQNTLASYRYGTINGKMDGSVIVTAGPDGYTIAYSSSGNVLWERNDFPRDDHTISVIFPEVSNEYCMITDGACYRIDINSGEILSRIENTSTGFSGGFYCNGTNTLCVSTKHQAFRQGSRQTSVFIEEIEDSKKIKKTLNDPEITLSAYKRKRGIV